VDGVEERPSPAVLEAGGVAAAVVTERGGVAAPDGVVVGGGVAFDCAGPGAALVLVTARRGRRAVLERSSPRRVEGRAGVEGAWGARPVATESGSEESPTRWPASWLAAQASDALTAMPSTAATAVATDRLVMARARYAGAR
jgi:hypothetical protein